MSYLSMAASKMSAEEPSLTSAGSTSSSAEESSVAPDSSTTIVSAPFRVPTKRITSPEHLCRFLQSPACAKLKNFMQALAFSVRGKRRRDVDIEGARKSCPALDQLMNALNNLQALISEFPALASTSASSRYGNVAFRDWFDAMHTACDSHNDGFNCPLGCDAEWREYWRHSFGNRTRIDYGTGHELNMVCGLLVVSHCPQRHFSEALLTSGALVLGFFWQYIEVCRQLQGTYLLEPAGSRGVWGLDDYYFCCFYFGASQLVVGGSADASSSSLKAAASASALLPTTSSVSTASSASDCFDIKVDGGDDGDSEELDLDAFIGGIKKSEILPTDEIEEIAVGFMTDKKEVMRLKEDYMFMDSVAFIFDMKTGMFSEHSPLLYDISGVKLWSKVCSGLFKMYGDEVLAKLPVMQHFLFGSVIDIDIGTAKAVGLSAADREAAERLKRKQALIARLNAKSMGKSKKSAHRSKKKKKKKRVGTTAHHSDGRVAATGMMPMATARPRVGATTTGAMPPMTTVRPPVTTRMPPRKGLDKGLMMHPSWQQ